MTQFAEQVRIRLISQLIKGISRVLQKLPKYFNDNHFHIYSTNITRIVFKSWLHINGLETVISSSGSSLQFCHKLPDVFE